MSAAARGELEPVTTVLLIVIASIAGGVVQYLLVRSVARPTLLRLLGRVASADRLDRQAQRLRRGGARSVAVARSTPGVRIIAVAASALAAIPATAFVLGLAIGNAVFITAHFGLGFVLGEPIRVSSAGPSLRSRSPGWCWRRSVRWAGCSISRRRGGDRAENPASIAEWADACCPACLTLAALDRTAA